MNRWISLFFVVLLIASKSIAQDNRAIKGRVFDQEDNQPLPGAQVQIKHTFLGDASDAEGHFEISRLEAKVYYLKITFIGYAAKEIRIDLRDKERVELQIGLSQSPIQMEQVVVTGSRQPENLSAAASSISVLPAREIQARNNFSVDKALLTVPGVEIVGENVNIRGGSGYNRLGGSRILVLIDDVPILTSDLATTNWNLIPVTAVDHVEVLKGSASSLYGSGALSGVVNIITKIPKTHQGLSFRQSIGIYDNPSVPQWKWTDKMLYYNRTDVGLNRNFGPLGIRVDVAHHFSTGYQQNSEFERWYLSSKLNWQFPDQSNVTGFVTFSQEDRQLFLRWVRQNDALQVPPTDRGNQYKLKGMIGYILYQKLFTHTLSTKLRVSYNQQLVGLPIQLTNAFRPAVGWSGEFQMNWLPHPDHHVSLGVDYKHDRVKSDYYGRQRANGISPYIQEIWKISRIWQMNIGLRYDTYTLVGDSVETQLSPRIGVSYQPWNGSILHASWGRGFRAASIVERFLSVQGGSDIRVVPNPLLKPERSTLFDIGWRQWFGKSVFAEVTAFSSWYSHLIELTLEPENLSVQFESYPDARIQGIETSLQWQIWKDHLSLEASATRMEPVFSKSKKILPYRPKLIAFVTSSFQYGSFSFAADYRYASRIDRVLVYPRDERVATKVWNLRFGYNWRGMKIQFLINNTVNYNYTISERVLGEIRNFAFAVSGDF